MRSFLLISALVALASALPAPRQSVDILDGCGDTKMCWGFFDDGETERDCDLGNEVRLHV